MKLRKGYIGLGIILLISLASAGWGDIGVEKLTADLEWRGLFIGTFYKFLLPSLVEFYSSLQSTIVANPPLYHSLIYGPLSSIIALLEPIYILSILACGFYLILVAGSPKGRARAKSLLPKLMASMVLVTLSPYILELILSASGELTKDLFSLASSSGNIFLETFTYLTQEFAKKSTLSLEGGHLFLVSAILMTLSIFTMITLRYLLITLLIIIFPLAIFLYFLDFTKSIGRKLLEQTFIWSFAQGAMALIFIVANLGITLLNLSGTLKILAGLGASILLVISPLILFLIVRRFLP